MSRSPNVDVEVIERVDQDLVEAYADPGKRAGKFVTGSRGQSSAHGH